jgi:hypothetical protein
VARKRKSDPEPAKSTSDGEDAALTALIRRHLVFGWWALAVYTTLGLVLEAAHGLKIGWYLDVGNATRRLSLTLGHAHGTLLGLINIAFALTLRQLDLSPAARARASVALRLATVLMPLGFALGAFGVYAGDPGLAIVLVPPSAVILIIGLVTVARGGGSKS